MLGRIGRDASSPLAIEIACDSVRILQLSRRAGGYRVSGWAIEPLAANPSSAALDHPLEVVQPALHRALQRIKRRPSKALLALSAQQVICRVRRMPAALTDSALEQLLLVEAEQMFPFPLDDLALDFQVLGPAPAEPDHVEVLVAACRQSLVDPLEQLCTSVGLQLMAVEVDSVALKRALPDALDPGCGLLQIEPDCAVLHQWNDGPIAQQQRLTYTASDDEAWLEPLESLCAGQGFSGRLTQLFITGALATERWSQHMSQRLGIRCELLAPLAKLDLDPADHALRAVAGCLSLPSCLALGALR